MGRDVILRGTGPDGPAAAAARGPAARGHRSRMPKHRPVSPPSVTCERVFGCCSRRWRFGLAVFLPGLLVSLVGGCFIPPDPLPDGDVVQPLIHIDKDRVEPKLSDSELLDRAGLGVFDARTAIVHPGIAAGKLHYAWYGDIDPQSGIPLPFYHACGNDPLCTLAPCKGLDKPNDDVHKLLLVVSSAPLPTASTAPFTFDDGVVFDWVEWQLNLIGECP